MHNSQDSYYMEHAGDYDAMHLGEPEHEIALATLFGYINHFQFESLLDVGAGTGRVLRASSHKIPNVRVYGIEPSSSMREIAYKRGVERDHLIEGNALHIAYPDNHWDVVSAFGILHHISEPHNAILEMCRVAKHGVFISDINNFGCGPLPQRIISQSLRAIGLWRVFQYIKNGFKYEKYSPGDGIHYSYSLYDSLSYIHRKFPYSYIMNTKGTSTNLYRGCPNICLFAIKDEEALIKRRYSTTLA